MLIVALGKGNSSNIQKIFLAHSIILTICLVGSGRWILHDLMGSDGEAIFVFKSALRDFGWIVTAVGCLADHSAIQLPVVFLKFNYTATLIVIDGASAHILSFGSSFV